MYKRQSNNNESNVADIDIDADGDITIDVAANKDILIGGAAVAADIKLGNSTTTTSEIELNSVLVDINAGTGGVDIDASGAIQMNSSGGTISIGNDDVAQNMNIGTGAAARTITIGNATGATTLDIDAGSGGIDVDTTGSLNLDGATGINIGVTANVAVDLNAAALDIDATGAVTMDTTDTSNGVKIATATSGVPVIIGHTTSEVTVGQNLTVGGDLTINGNDITFGNGETISNETDGTVAITATTTSLSGNLLVSGNTASFGNGATIVNTDTGTLTITEAKTAFVGDVSMNNNLYIADNIVTTGDLSMNSLSKKIRMKKHIDTSVSETYGHKITEGKIVTITGSNRFQMKFWRSGTLSVGGHSDIVRINNSYIESGDIIYAHVTGEQGYDENPNTQMDTIAVTVMNVTNGQFSIIFTPLYQSWSGNNACIIDFIVFG